MYEYLVLVLTKRNTEIADLNHLSLGFPASQFLQFVQQGQNFFVLGQQIQNAILRRDRIPIIHGVRMTYSTHASFFYVSEYGFRSESIPHRACYQQKLIDLQNHTAHLSLRFCIE